MRENSREGKIRWIKFNCCAKQTVLVKQKRKQISFLKNVSIFFRDESKARARTISQNETSRKNTTDEQQTKKESTSEKSGEREDGFEGGERRRTFGVVFEDS